jgi:predicted MFS family arabinose efflux permease
MRGNPWLNCRGLPPGPRAVLAALHLYEPWSLGLKELTEREWREALSFCDRSRLTLLFRDAAAGFMPDWALERTNRDAVKNASRLKTVLGLHRNLEQWISAEGIETLILKGVTQYPDYCERLESRAQYDVDLFCGRAGVDTAQNALIARGYEPMASAESRPADHLPTLIRKTGWEWRGDFFDPEIPLAVELHFQFWDVRTERLPAPGVEEFWSRRIAREIAGMQFTTLHPVDALGYASLHFLRHVLRGSLALCQAYELAYFLNSRAKDEAFWEAWRVWHSPALRRLEAVSFHLAQSWFGGQACERAQEEVAALPEMTKAWFDSFALSPVTGLYGSNKDELWLHLSLLESRRDVISVARRRLLPGRLPGPVDAVYIPEREMTWRRQALKQARYAAYMASRFRHHVFALPRAGGVGARWWWRANTLGEQFWIFLSAAALYNLALFIFVLLYNLRLLDLGFREGFLGAVSGANTAGCVAGALPAALLARRCGLRKILLGCFAVTAVITALRALSTSQAPLIALAFANGIAFAFWAVLMAPMVAQAVPEKRRPAAFSIFTASLIGIGVAGGWLGGRLSLWLHSKQSALLFAAGIIVAALWPAAHMKERAGLGQDGRPVQTGLEAGLIMRILPRGSFLPRFLAPIALWNLATGSFNPFFNAYFARLRFSVEGVGSVFSAAQFTQVIAILLAPALFRKAGLVAGIAWTMAAAALGLAGLAAQPARTAALVYTAYMAFQYMSEPGMNTLLMNRTGEREREGASALNFLVAFSAQALAAIGAGLLLSGLHDEGGRVLLRGIGYTGVLCGAAVLAGIAAALFRALLGVTETSAEPLPSLQAPAAGSVPE